MLRCHVHFLWSLDRSSRYPWRQSRHLTYVRRHQLTCRHGCKSTMTSTTTTSVDRHHPRYSVLLVSIVQLTTSLSGRSTSPEVFSGGRCPSRDLLLPALNPVQCSISVEDKVATSCQPSVHHLRQQQPPPSRWQPVMMTFNIFGGRLHHTVTSPAQVWRHLLEIFALWQYCCWQYVLSLSFFNHLIIILSFLSDILIVVSVTLLSLYCTFSNYF